MDNDLVNEPGMDKKTRGRYTAKGIAITGITAAVYAVATVLIAPLSFGAVQFRLSEILVLLAFIDAGYGSGLILGCAIANCFSFEIGPIDVVVGTFATFVSVLAITRTKSLFVATLWPVLSGLIIGAELSIVLGLPYLLTSAQVMFGQFVVVTLMGYPIFKVILKNDRVVDMLRFSNKQ